MKTLALDASTKCTGWSVFEDGSYIKSGMIAMAKDKDTEHRITAMTVEIIKVIKDNHPDKIYLEDTTKMANASTFKCLCWLAGGIKFWAHLNEYDIELVMPSAWRTHVHIQEFGTKRTELKQRAIDLCEEKFGFVAEEDVAEAILINYAMAIRDKVVKF